MIDLHTHLLPGVDDGSKSLESSLEVLARFARDGVTTVVCTPHLEASHAHDAPHGRHEEIFAQLTAAAARPPELRRGWEILLDVPGADLSDPRLGLGGSTARLVEFARLGLPANADKDLLRIHESGLVPVVAHPERYWGCTPAVVERWKAAGAVIQMDVTAILRRGRPHKLAEELIANGLIDLFASDTHVDRRSLAIAREWLTDVTTADNIRLLTFENARRLLADEPTAPVWPIVLRQSMVRRLGELVFGRT
jgi:protein-tyrosine phosphatase